MTERRLTNGWRGQCGGLVPVLLAGVCLPVCGCHLLPFKVGGTEKIEAVPLPGMPARHSFRLAPYVFYSDFEIPRNSPIFRDLGGLRDQIYRDLRLPPGNAMIQVYLFKDRESYESFIKQKHPDWPIRRAYFQAQAHRGGGEDLLVYTYWNNQVIKDLRHELTHALLNSVLKSVPMWLDEGLAEFFEVPQVSDGLNVHHVERLKDGTFQPNLTRLEQLSDFKDMTLADYRESWAWVHLMLRDKNPQARKVLVDYLRELTINPNPGSLRPRLAAVFLSPEEALVRHLAGLETSPQRR